MLRLTDNAPTVLLDIEKPSKNILGDCDCADCACSLVNNSRLLPIRDTPEVEFEMAVTSNKQISDSGTLFYGPFHEPAVLNESAVKLLNQFRTPKTEVEVNPFHTREIAFALSKLQQARLIVPKGTKYSIESQNQELSAWLHVTDRCNLRCKYCYLPHTKDDMSWDTGKEIIDTIFETAVNHKYREIKLKYSGGEALLRFPLVKQLHQYAQNLAQRHQLKVYGTVLSNGTLLTPIMARDMHALGLNLMISMDGLGQLHDAHRPYSGGRGTFADVQEGVAIAQKVGLNTIISITISGINAHGLAELVRWVLEKKLRFSLNFYRENKRSDEKLTFEDEKIVSGMLAAYKEIEQNMPDYNLLDAIVDRANLSAPHLHTCGVGQNYMVFDHNGRVNKCQMHLYDGPPNQATNQPLIWIRNTSEGIQNLSVEKKEECNGCEWKYWCAGGCPLVTFQATGVFNKRSPNCAIYKAIYPEAMRLEGLRLLQINH